MSPDFSGKKLKDKKIKILYQKGIRDFSGVICPLGDFTGVDLSGANFKGADLKYSSFFKANLSGVDFSNADLKWSSFAEANLSNCKFNNCDASYSNFNNSRVDNTNFENADINWCTLFNVNLSNAILQNTKVGLSIFSAEEATLEGTKHVLEVAEGLPIPIGVAEVIKKVITESLGEERIKEALASHPTTNFILPNSQEINDRIYRVARGETSFSLHVYSSDEQGSLSLYASGRRVTTGIESPSYSSGRPSYTLGSSYVRKNSSYDTK